MGELLIEGEAIERLLLEKKPGRYADGNENLVKLVEPGPRVSLPAGEYRVYEVRLRGLYVCWPSEKIGEALSSKVRVVGWFTISPDKPHTIHLGAPLKPILRVCRSDRTLRMAYDLHDVSGREFWTYQPVDFHGGKMADITVYSGHKLVGSGLLSEYG
jgi:hypothetical protein